MLETENQVSPTREPESDIAERQDLSSMEESSSDEIEIVALSIDGMCGVY